MSIERLPVEILHRIFDNLDAQTILFSIRPVCRLFHAVANTYNRYSFDFKSVSKANFYLLCRLINPQNVISLTLCDNEYTPNQIALFISLVRVRQLTRLHSMTFIGIEEFQLNKILKHMNRNSLTSFSLNIRKYDDRRKKTTLNFLSSIIAQSSLRKIELDIKIDRISNISWPLNCRIEYLTINEDITFADMCQILSCSPQLHTLIVKQSLVTTMNNIIRPSSFPQLTSLSIENLHVSIDKLESFLLLVPSLMYLQLIGEEYVFDGKRWEQFIQINLPHLDKFEFFIEASRLSNQTREDLELIIGSFRSPFWVEYKKWFVVVGEFNMNRRYEFQIYSIPICKSVLQCELYSEKVFVSNSTITSYSDPSIINNINEIILSLKKPTIGDAKKEELTRTIPLFPKITKLHINVDRQTDLDVNKYLPSIINVSQLVQVKLESNYFNKFNKSLLFNVITIIEQSDNLSSLIIHNHYGKYALYPFLSNICSIIPRQIKHLRIPINQLDQMKIILERCQYLSVVQFEITRSKLSEEIIEWFVQNTIDSTFWRHDGCDIIWIGKRTHENRVNHKRIKLTDD